MKIGIVIGRIGGIDGVALETEKWIEVLEDRLGHEVALLTGEVEAPTRGVTLLPELAFSHPDCVRDQEDAFFEQKVPEAELMERLERGTARIEEGIRAWLAAEGIDLLITQNATALPCHLTMGMALRRVIERTGIPALAHDHDFYWERGMRYSSRYAGVRSIIVECFPPELPSLRHVVINSYCRDSLRDQLGMESFIIPNVMDFENGFGRPDAVTRRLPGSLGLDDADLLLFQITRIVRRKGIETAIDLIDRLDDPRVKLVITGTSKDDHKDAYLHELRERVAGLGREDQVLFAGDRFANVRAGNGNGSTTFSLSDGYAAATACTYFSRYEGFGNAFVEALAARRPIFVNNYKPVYWPDIGSLGFRTVQIEDNELTDDSVESVRGILDDEELRRDIAEHNYELGRRHFSYDVLAELLRPLLDV